MRASDTQRVLRAYEVVEATGRPIGEWQSIEIVSKNGQIDTFLNGTPISHVSEHPFKEPGHIAIQYQGGTWVYRNIRIKSE